MGKTSNTEDYFRGLNDMQEVHNYHAKMFYGNATVLNKELLSLGRKFIRSASDLITNLGTHKSDTAVNNNFFV